MSVFLFVMASFGLVAVNAQTLGPDDIKIVDVYQSGALRSVPTREKTVGSFLESQDIVVSENDIVEPALSTEISSEEFQVSIFKARPLRVIDDGQTKQHLSGYTDMRLAANELGYNLDPADEITQEFTDDLNVGRTITILRANDYSVNVYGQIIQIKSQSNAVSDILTEAGVTVAEGDTVKPGFDESIDAGSSIIISRLGTDIITVEEEIAFEIVTNNDSSLTTSQTEVDAEGVVGIKSVIYEIELENDVEIGRTVIQEIVVREPVTKVQRRGTKAPFVSSNNVSSDKQFLMAAAGIAESDWGYVDYIVSKESGWNAAATNRSSGAYGLCQSFPASKMASAGADWQTNPVTQLKWCSGYANGRYGSWANAYSAWISKSWW